MFELLDILGLLLLFAVSVFFVVLIHELGHAAAVLVCSKGDVNIYVGSYGEADSSLHIRTGRLTTHIKYNPIKWRIGICVPPKIEISTNRQIIYVAAGPLTSVLSGIIALYIFKYLNPGVIRFELMFFGIFSVFVGIVNLFPFISSKRSHSGRQITSDGYKLIQLFRLRSMPQEYVAAMELFNKKEFAESSKILETLVETGNNNKHILRLAINSNLQAKNLQRGDELITLFLKKHLPNSDDYCNAGYTKSMLKDEEAALSQYKKSLELNSGNVVALSNMGHSLIELGRCSEAIKYLDAAISESPKFCNAHSNLALAKLHLGDLEGGMEVIQACLELDPDFAEAHTCLGIYNLKKGNLPEARECFEKAKALDSDDLTNDDYLRKVEEMMGKNIL